MLQICSSRPVIVLADEGAGLMELGGRVAFRLA